MLIRRLSECPEFQAGDNCRLRELLHPDKMDIQVNYSLAHATVHPGQTTWNHRLTGASEVYYIIQGQGVMHIDGEECPVEAGAAVYIPPGSRQFIRNTGEEELRFICMVDPAWRPDYEDVFGEKGDQ